MSTSTVPNASGSAVPTEGLRSKMLGLASLVTGIVSFFAGITLLVPIAGLVAGFFSLRREPAGRTLAVWGIILNTLALIGGVIVAVGIILTFIGTGLTAFLPA
ncbi:hypothetical protein M0722_11580 [Microbacterium sp. KSW4-16]|uniref:hypothetical protein n=1 Tax=Microbacterium TaxID=33882 RepID=UPI001D14CAA3|nr:MULTISPECIES: hypothetical protein [Microbacterium]MCK8467833.1 hypothetical protein [Microbacterium aurugineum]